MTKPEQPSTRLFELQHQFKFGHSTFVINSEFVIRNSSFSLYQLSTIRFRRRSCLCPGFRLGCR